MSELPVGWASTSLGEISESEVDKRGPDPSGETFRYVDISSIDRTTKRIVDPALLLTTAAPSRARQNLSAGDVLVSMTRPNLNAVAKVPSELGGSIGSTGFHVLRARLVSSDWLYYRVQAPDFISAMSMRVQGALYPAVRPSDIAQFVTNLPPRQEQDRIVAEIDKQFTRLDAATAALRRVQANLKRYRASVLKAACEGRLVPTEAELARKEGRDYEPADQLLQRILLERRTRWEADTLAKMIASGKPPKDDRWKEKYKEPIAPDTSNLPALPEGWCWAYVDQLALVVRGASPRPAGDPRFFGGDIPWITVGSITRDDDIYLELVTEFVTDAGKRASRCVPADTLLLTNSGATLGVPKITMIEGCINDGSVALLGVDYPEKLFLYFFFSSLTKSLRAINQGAAQPNLNTQIVKSISVPLPPRAEQLRIIQRLQQLWSLHGRLFRQTEMNEKHSASLRSAILREAFAGRLVPQDPADEPVGALLGRSVSV